MPRMTERLRTVLRGIGPEGIRAGLAILLGALALLVLSLAAIRFGLVGLGREEAEQETGGEQYTISVGPQPEDFPLIFGPGPSPDIAQASSADGRPLGIPGLSDMDVIGELQYVPGTTFHCPGGGPAGGGLTKRTCTSSSADDPAAYEVTVVEDDPSTVLSVVATAQNATDEEAAAVLGYVARASVGAAGPLGPEAWVERSISSGGQYLSNGAEVRLYGTEGIRTLEIIASASPAVDQGTETTERATEGTTEGTTERTTNGSPK